MTSLSEELQLITSFTLIDGLKAKGAVRRSQITRLQQRLNDLKDKLIREIKFAQVCSVVANITSYTTSRYTCSGLSSK